MTKILLVEDDRSLQEIYGVRLNSEGYSVLIAGDGEEALNVALKEKPDLILSDVMMPKISGFDMLDILRTTPEIKDTKVIIMTALSSDDQRERGESLGADVYLVKSQVGIEDVIQAVKDLLEDKIGRKSGNQISAPTNSLDDMPMIDNSLNFIPANPPSLIQSQPAAHSIKILSETDLPNANQQPVINPNSAAELEGDLNLTLNPQYRQPTPLRDIIPERDDLNGQ